MRKTTKRHLKTVLFIAFLQFFGFSNSAYANLIFYTNESDWLTSVSGLPVHGSIRSLSNYALANELTSAPNPGDVVGPKLTFDRNATGMPWSLTIEAQPGAQLAALDRHGGMLASTTADQQDDFHLTIIDSMDLLAFGFFLDDNHLDAKESVTAYDTTGLVLGTSSSIPLSPNGQNAFFGVVSDTAIGSIYYDEDAGTDQVHWNNFLFAGVTSRTDSMFSVLDRIWVHGDYQKLNSTNVAVLGRTA